MSETNTGESFPYKILVIDDQVSHLRLMKKWLTRLGYRVVTVDSAEEAVEMIQWGERFSLIITDIKMPWLNGIQFCKQVKARYPEFGVVALSGHISEFDRQEMESSGFDGIYEKPITEALLKEILEDASSLSGDP